MSHEIFRHIKKPVKNNHSFDLIIEGMLKVINLSGINMVSNNAEKIAYKKYNEQVKHFRSEIIENVTSLEIQLEWIISSYFSKNFNDYALFDHLFFADNVQLGFHDKIMMFEKLLDLKLKDLHKKYPDIVMRLNKCRKVRNRFAHGEALDPWPHHLKNMKKQVIFVIIEKGEQKEADYTFDFLKEVIKDSYSLNGVLSKQIRELKKQNSIDCPQELSKISNEN